MRKYIQTVSVSFGVSALIAACGSSGTDPSTSGTKPSGDPNQPSSGDVPSSGAPSSGDPSGGDPNDGDPNSGVVPTRAAGTVVSNRTPALTSNQQFACESPWTIRMLIYHPGPTVPRLSYSASCTPPNGKTKFFTSATVKGAENTETSGVVIESELDPTTGALKPSGVQRPFSECREMHGIAAKSDCSVVGVLCRRPTGPSADATKDMVAALPDSGGMKAWITQPGSEAQGKQRNDEEWLYEWKDGNLATVPAKYVAHKAIGGWEYGSQALVYGESDNTYGLSLKATVYGGGAWHEGDALLVVDRSNYSINDKRGWQWGCAAGHTLFNHPAFNPVTSRYTVTCGTDLGIDPKTGGGFGGLWTHTEGKKEQGYKSVPLFKSLSIGGGPTSLIPIADGGFIGVFASVDGAITPNQDFKSNDAVTSIGFAHFDKDGALVGKIKRVASAPGVFLSYPQLAPLGKGTFLLGYGRMAAVADKAALKVTYDDALRVPASYHVLEVDENGNALTATQTLAGAGWGEQDQMVALGEGRVGWAYTPNAVRVGDKIPACASNELALHVYTQK
jgi:hypothetical protein